MTTDSGLPPDPLHALRAALGAQYTIERLLGQGGMGSVYLAHDVTLDRPVAIKVINPDVSGNATLRSRFLQEARTVARLRHPNIGVAAEEVRQARLELGRLTDAPPP